MKKTCVVSGVEFEITDEDLKFYETMGVPAPTLCPSERMRRRLAHRNERCLYRKPCSICNKATITIFSSESGIPVGCDKCWWGDSWDATKYGRDFDFSRPFFEQFAELQKEVPHMALWNFHSENSEYNHCCFNNRNCYLNFCTDESEDTHYTWISDNCKNVLDSIAALHCELCYELTDCERCFDCAFLQNCQGCSGSWFLKDCIGCHDCFGCVNLRNKKFHFLNEPLAEEDYRKKVSELNLHSFSALDGLRDHFKKFCLKFPHRYAQILQSENCTGNYIFKSKNAQECFDVYGMDDGKYVWYGPRKNENVMDGYAVARHNHTYECISGDQLNNSKFIAWVSDGPHNSEYCFFCVNGAHDLFGCVGLKKAQYCILNKQYSKEEFEVLREKIIAHMKETGEWGEFYPASMSAFGYNETLANEYFPLTKDEALKRGFKWKEQEKKDYQTATLSDLPDSIQDTEDSICDEVLACSVCKKELCDSERRTEVLSKDEPANSAKVSRLPEFRSREIEKSTTAFCSCV